MWCAPQGRVGLFAAIFCPAEQKYFRCNPSHGIRLLKNNCSGFTDDEQVSIVSKSQQLFLYPLQINYLLLISGLPECFCTTYNTTCKHLQCYL